MDQPVDLAQLPACAGTAAALVLGDAFHRRDAHAKELVQIVRIDAEKSQAFQKGYFRTGSFEEDTLIKIHPADVTFYIRTLLFCFA